METGDPPIQPGQKRDSLIRSLAFAKLRELRRAGMSYSEIGRRYGVPDVSRSSPGTFTHRLPPERLLRRDPRGAGGEDRATFLKALDAVDQGLMFLDCGQRLLHRNRAFIRILDSGLEGVDLDREIEHFVHTLCGLVELRRRHGQPVVESLAVRDLPAALGNFRLRGSYIGLDLFGSGSCLLIALEQATPQPLSDLALKLRFGLTKQECRITRLLVDGRSNAEIAGRLLISPHTARHHTEKILRKLDVKSRAEVAGRLSRLGEG